MKKSFSKKFQGIDSYRNLWKQIQQKKVSSHDAFHFTLQSDQFAHTQQSATFKVEEIIKNSERFENYMTTAMKSSMCLLRILLGFMIFSLYFSK